jgi:transposase
MNCLGPFSIPNSTGTIHKMATKCVEKISLVVNGIREKLLKSHLNSGALQSATVAFHIEKYNQITHAVCCAHLFRELTGIIENHLSQTWAEGMIDLFLTMKEVERGLCL